MKQQEPRQEETVHSGKQVVLRLVAFVAAIIVIVILYKMLLG